MKVVAMDIESINRWLGSMALMIGIINALWLWLRSPMRRAEARIDEVEDEIEEEMKALRANDKGHDRRIQTLEGEMKHRPTKDDLNAINIVVVEIEGKINANTKELESIARTVRRIDDHLRKDGSSK